MGHFKTVVVDHKEVHGTHTLTGAKGEEVGFTIAEVRTPRARFAPPTQTKSLNDFHYSSMDWSVKQPPGVTRPFPPVDDAVHQMRRVFDKVRLRPILESPQSRPSSHFVTARNLDGKCARSGCFCAMRCAEGMTREPA
jgi:hypothetical protein